MRKFNQRGTWLLSTLMLVLWAVPASAQIRILPPANEAIASQQIDGLLRRAAQFEAQQRWGDALSVYEEGLREYPNEPTLGDRHSQARIHYDLARRYNDNSFLRALTTTAERDALNLYSEVLAKIDTHYVTAPNWGQLVDRGTLDLEIALGQAPFQQRHLRGKSPAQVDAFVQQLRGLIRSRSVRTRQQALDAVTAAMQLGNRSLGLPGTAVAMEYACAAIGSLDTYSSYLTTDQLNDVYSQIEGNFVGLGIELKANGGALQIVKVITGSPAERAGIRAGDRIVEVDGKATAELSTDAAANLLQGPEGSMVDVLVLDVNEVTRRLRVRREHVEVPSVDDVKIIDRDSGIGYLKLTCFQKTTSRDLDAALWKLHREGMRSLIMDLRGNPGGLLTSSVEVADKFLEQGVIVSTRGRSSLEDFSYTAHKAGTWRVPLVVMIDGDSASASEIFAGAIRDHRRGHLVGERSYGKGSVQGIFPLTTAGTGVRLTTAKFFSPNGQPIALAGVHPDIVVRKAAKPSDSSVAGLSGELEDHVLHAAVQAAQRQMAQRAETYSSAK